MSKRPDSYISQVNLRCCHTCKLSMMHYDGDLECEKHHCFVGNLGICDDWEEAT